MTSTRAFRTQTAALVADCDRNGLTTAEFAYALEGLVIALDDPAGLTPFASDVVDAVRAWDRGELTDGDLFAATEAAVLR